MYKEKSGELAVATYFFFSSNTCCNVGLMSKKIVFFSLSHVSMACHGYKIVSEHGLLRLKISSENFLSDAKKVLYKLYNDLSSKQYKKLMY